MAGSHRFVDHLVIASQRLHTFALPARVLEEFDAVIVNPGPARIRSKTLQTLSRGNGSRRATVGIIATSDWTAADLEAVRSTGVWLYANEGEMYAMSRAVASDIEPTTLQDAACQIRKRLGGADRVVATAAELGAYLLNSDSEPIHVRAVPIPQPARISGNGDVAAFTGTSSSAAGAPDRVCVARAVRAGSRHAAGLPLACSLEELDHD